MKRLLLVTMGTASFLLSSAQVPIDEAHFPDDFFRDYVSQHFDADEDVQLDDEEIRAVVQMDLTTRYFSKCTSLKGLEFFVYLQDLELGTSGRLKELDVSANVNLERLSCRSIKIQELDLRQNRKLEFLKLTSLSELSSLALDCPKLDTLILSSLSLGTLDVSASPDLVYVECSKCELAALDLKHCAGLKVLDCSENSLKTLDLNDKAQLESFKGDGQKAVSVSPVDGWLDLSTLSGFDASRSYDWEGVFRYGDSIVFDQTQPIKDYALAKYKYKTGIVSGPGSKIECCLKCNAEDLPVLLGRFGEISSDWLYDADGDGRKEYYMVDREKNVKARYHWHVPGRYALDFKLDLPFTYLQEDRMMTHLNNDGVPDFANPVFTDLRKIEIALSGADGTYTLMDGCNSAYPLDVNHDGLPDLFAFNNTDWSIFYQNPDGTFTATRIDTLSRVQADS